MANKHMETRPTFMELMKKIPTEIDKISKTDLSKC